MHQGRPDTLRGLLHVGSPPRPSRLCGLAVGTLLNGKGRRSQAQEASPRSVAAPHLPRPRSPPAASEPGPARGNQRGRAVSSTVVGAADVGVRGRDSAGASALRAWPCRSPHWALGPEMPLGVPKGQPEGVKGSLWALKSKNSGRDPGSTGSWLRTDTPRSGLWASISRSVRVWAMPPFCVAAVRTEDLGGWKGPPHPSVPSLTHRAVGTGVPFLLPQVPSANQPKHRRCRRPRRLSPQPRPTGGASPKGCPMARGNPLPADCRHPPQSSGLQASGTPPACLLGPCPTARSLPHCPLLGGPRAPPASASSQGEAPGLPSGHGPGAGGRLGAPSQAGLPWARSTPCLPRSPIPTPRPQLSHQGWF